MAKREQLVDKLADLDDDLASIILERESLQQLSDKEIESALRRVTLERVNQHLFIKVGHNFHKENFQYFRKLSLFYAAARTEILASNRSWML